MTNFALLLLTCILAPSQNLYPSAQEVDAAWKKVREADAPFAGLVKNDRLAIHWVDSDRLWYRASRNGRQEFVLVNGAKGTKGPAFDHEKVAEDLGALLGKKLDSRDLKLDQLSFGMNDQLSGLTIERKSYLLKNGKWIDAPASAKDTLDRLRPVSWRARPGRDGPESSILFDNQLKKPVEIFWVDGDQNRKSYGQIAPGATRNQHTFAGHIWVIRLDDKVIGYYRAGEKPGRVVIDKETLANPEPEKGPGRAGANPNPGEKIYAHEHNLFQRLPEGKAKQLTNDGTDKDGYKGAIFVAPGGKHAIAMRTLKGDHRKLTLVETAPKDQLQPKVVTVDYPKPGDAIDRDMPHLFDLENSREIPLDGSWWENPWTNDSGRWSADGSKFWFLHNRRGHQLLRLMEIDAATGKTRVVVEEKSPTFIDYAHKHWWRILPDKNRVIWMSERSGHNHLHLFELASGKELPPITSGNWVVRDVDRYDEKTGEFRLKIGGFHPNQDPYHIHFAKAFLDGRPVVCLTESDGTHELEEGPEAKFVVARHSRVDLLPVTELRDASTGKKILELEKTEDSALKKAGWRPPERFTAPGRDGKTPIYGIIHKPRDFNPAKKYPVIEYIYAGPQDAFVPKSFRLSAGPGRMAEIGAIVVQIDGMGTSRRSKAFHDVCWKNLADAGFPDRKLWIKAAASSRPWMDLSRVGIYGGSAGGQNALRALLSHGDFYHVAAADCGCHDNRIDKIWWNELWMGWPIGPHYQAQAAQTEAAKLQGKLLLTVGEMDRNVDPACTLRVVQALIQAGKTFEYLVLPGLGHGAGESPFAARQRIRFFLQHLVLASPGG